MSVTYVPPETFAGIVSVGECAHALPALDITLTGQRLSLSRIAPAILEIPSPMNITNPDHITVELPEQRRRRAADISECPNDELLTDLSLVGKLEGGQSRCGYFRTNTHGISRTLHEEAAPREYC